jgi:hypothetical protein
VSLLCHFHKSTVGVQESIVLAIIKAAVASIRYSGGFAVLVVSHFVSDNITTCTLFRQ